MAEVPMVASWMGVPLSEVPREELEQALIDTHRQLEQAQKSWCEASVGEVRALAALRREQLRPVLGLKL